MKRLLVIPILLFWCLSAFAGQPVREMRFAKADTYFQWEWRFCAGFADICFGADFCELSWNIDSKYIDAIRFLCTTGGTTSKIRLLTDGAGSGTVRMGLYDDNGSHYPGDLIWEGTDQTYVADAWIEEVVTSITLVEGTYYWAAFKDNSDGKICYDARPSSYPYDHSYSNQSVGSYPNSFPDPWPSFQSGNDNLYIIQVCISGGVAETYSGKFPRGVARGIVR